MKKTILIVCIIMTAIFSSSAQSKSKNFTILDFNFQNFKEINSQFKDETNFYIVGDSKVLAPVQISSVLTNKQVDELHIYVPCKPGSIVFSNIALTPDNVEEYAFYLSQWAAHVTGKVVIQDSEVFTTQRGLELKIKLEKITGLNFTTL